MSPEMLNSLRRIAGLLCYALAALMLVALITAGINQIFWVNYSVVKDVRILSDLGMNDVIVFLVMGLITMFAALAGCFLKPGSFSLASLIVGLTLTTLAIGAITSYLRMDGF